MSKMFVQIVVHDQTESSELLLTTRISDGIKRINKVLELFSISLSVNLELFRTNSEKSRSIKIIF